MCIGNDYGPSEGQEGQARPSNHPPGHKQSRGHSHRSRRKTAAHQQQQQQQQDLPLQDLPAQTPPGPSARPAPPEVRSLEDLGYIVAPEVQQAAPPGVQLFTVRYPPSYGPADVACLGVHTTRSQSHRGRLVVDYISMRGNPPMRKRLCAPHASDVLLGFWCFTAGRALGELGSVEIVSVAERTLTEARPRLYAGMGRGLHQRLAVRPAHGEPFSTIRGTRFGKMADYMLGYQGMESRHVAEYQVIPRGQSPFDFRIILN